MSELPQWQLLLGALSRILIGVYHLYIGYVLQRAGSRLCRDLPELHRRHLRLRPWHGELKRLRTVLARKVRSVRRLLCLYGVLYGDLLQRFWCIHLPGLPLRFLLKCHWPFVVFPVR